ncbi:MAG TPA: SGNH/GDSL hydrolase family protein [Thermoanaerobaculia bacterium]|jgi:lysophospholipase L1-like esterase
MAERPLPSPKPRRILAGLVVAVVSTAACLVLLEGAVRVASAFFHPKMMEFDLQLGWRHRPSAQRMFTNEWGERFLVVQNSRGLRGRDGEGGRRRAGVRVLVLGDSFTEGVHVAEDEVFAARLERTLPGSEVLNAGVGGYGTVQEYLYLRNEGLAHDPDVVVLMFYDNDLVDNCLSYAPGLGPRPYAVWRDGRVQIVDTIDGSDYAKFTLPVPFRLELDRHSYLFNLVNSRIYQKLAAQRMRRWSQADFKRTDGCGRYPIFFGLVTRMADLLRVRGKTFALVLIPTAVDVASGSSPTQTPIVRFCAEKALTCVALLPRFVREHANGTRLYFATDIHWTKEGHRVAAEEVAARLRPALASRR